MECGAYARKALPRLVAAQLGQCAISANGNQFLNRPSLAKRVRQVSCAVLRLDLPHPKRVEIDFALLHNHDALMKAVKGMAKVLAGVD